MEPAAALNDSIFLLYLLSSTVVFVVFVIVSVVAKRETIRRVREGEDILINQ